MIECTLVLLKPDIVRKHQIGEVLEVFEKKGLEIFEMEMVHLAPSAVDEFYRQHVREPWYDQHRRFMSSGPCLALVLKGDNAIKTTRDILGATDPRRAVKGTIRHMYGVDLPENAAHASDSVESAKQELRFFFPEL
jgi:nucleoside-diphosphate kinase